jgi:tripartite-type tricarboxylate transporter receptor subunit TctC
MMRFLAAAALTAASMILAPVASAQTFPARSVTMIVPFAAGGPSDTIARLLAQGMSADLGQQVVVENVAGAGGTIAIDRVAKAQRDGHTILISHVNHATAATLYRRLPYRSADDFETIGIATDGPMVLVTRQGFPANSITEVLAAIRREGDRLKYGHAGVGSGSHLCGLMLFSALQQSPTIAAYRGTGPAMNDLLGGQLDLLCDQVTSAISQIRGGRVRAFAVTSTGRIPAFPDLPTLAESGLANFEVNVWHGLYAPRGTPAPIVERLNRAMRTALDNATVRARLDELSTIPATGERLSPAYHARHLRAEIEKWGAVIRAAGEFAE